MALRAVLFVLVMTTGSIHALGQTPTAPVPRVLRAGGQISCYAVVPGDTAASLAQRLTGSTANRHRPWFHIVDPATATTVKKLRYDAIQSGWHVCVPSERLSHELSVPLLSAQDPKAPIRNTPAGGAIGEPPVRAAVDLSVLWWVVPLSMAVSGLVLAGTRKFVGHRRAVLEIMSGFGGKFVSEFERPLFRPAADAAVSSRLRFAPIRRRLEILLAPAAGRTYPNLTDHKRNVEYDVHRVVQTLRDASFTCGAPYAEGHWVVIPFRFDIDRQQEGGP